MMSRFVSLFGSVLSLVGCSNPNAPIMTTAGDLTQQQVDAIVEQCGGPSRMGVIQNGSLIIKPASDVAVTSCVLEALHATGETSLPTVTVDSQLYERTGAR
ncbi:hypothetical protein [Sphingopyxis sp.]|uniref:hypothetical protein n=1 Tax=Sphingopyxis sp. TaxID=1908224 RepID=UPI0025F8A44B|nr:hypothetical protein [Sphingopyxis sp.]